MAEDDYFWTSLSQSMAERYQGLLNIRPTGEWDQLPREVASSLALVASARSRESFCPSSPQDPEH
jgi:hypothetical protein